MDTVIVASSQFYSHYPKRIPMGTVNAEAVLIRLDSEWDDLTVRIHWINVATGLEKVVLLERDLPNTIPWEVLTDLGELRMGLVGMDGEKIIKPTIWLTYGYVVEGVDPESGDDPQPPTPSWEQQMVEQATQANQAAQDAKEYAQQVAESIESAGPYAQEAKEAAEAAKAAQNAAATSAQQANAAAQTAQEAVSSIGNAVDLAQSAATAAGSAQRAAETAQAGAAQSAQAAAGSASAAQTAKAAAEAAATILPTPTQEDAGKAPIVNSEGTGYVFGQAGGSVPYALLYSGTVEEANTMEVLITAEKPIKSIVIYAITPADDGPYSLQCYARINHNDANQLVFGIGNLFQTTRNVGVVFFEKDKTLGLYTQKASKKITTWYNGPINEEVFFERSANVGLSHNTIAITKNASGKSYPFQIGTELIVGVKYE